MTPCPYRARPAAGDFALTALLLGLCVWAIGPLSRGLASRSGIAQVFHDGRLVRQVELDHDQCITVADGRMTLTVKKGRIRIAQSDCPRQTCRHAGWISRPSQTLICAPNRVVIAFPDDAATAECDAIAR
jgi:hypothetical protein